MPRRSALSIEERNAIERTAIQRGKQEGYDKRGNMLVGYVEGFMAAIKLTPQERIVAAGATKKPRAKQLKLVEGAEAK